MNCICEKEKCTGCAACQNICPVEAVTMELNNEGFLYPRINSNLCIHCEKCKSICPQNHAVEQNLPFQVYKAYSNDLEVLKKSTSGGIFSELAKQIIAMGGIVFGARLNSDFSVSHYYSETLEGCFDMCGSKYIGSRINNCYKEVKKFLINKKNVMFSGTPCEIAGLKSYLEGTDQSRLLTCDFICHGVGSEKVFKNFVSFLEEKNSSRVKKIYFRKKCGNYHHSKMVVVFENNLQVKMPSYRNPFGFPFSTGKINRISCSICPYANSKRVSDITLSDLIHNLSPKEARNGASMVLINTDQGMERINHCDIFKTNLTLDYALLIQSHLSRPQQIHSERSQIFATMNSHSFEEMANKYFIPEKKSIFKRVKIKLWKLLKNKE